MTTTTKVYKYGARNPGAAPLLRTQMTLGRNYYNALVAAENRRRRLGWSVASGTITDTVPAPPHDDCRCAECKAHWKAIRQAVHDLPRLDKRPMRKHATASGLHWGTYLLIERAFDQADRTTGATRELRFRSWRQGGVVGIQIQQAAWRRNQGASLFAIAPQHDPRTGVRKTRGGGRHELQLRVGSVDRKPLWSEPIKYEQHRHMLGRITWVAAHMHYRGRREVWHVCVTCADVPGRIDGATTGTVAVDVGWRQEDGGIRIAVARGDDDHVDTLHLGPRWVEISNRADRIRSYRDRRVEELIGIEPGINAASTALTVRRRVVHPLRPETAAWLKRDFHLEDYEVGLRRRSIAVRQDALRVWARRLRRRYATLVVKNSSAKRFQESKDLPPPTHRQRHHAAPGEVVEWLTQVFGRDATNVVDAMNTTATCVACGHVEDAVGPDTVIKCSACGDERDRDERSTRNMLRQEWLKNAGKPTERKTTAKWAKRHKQAS